MNTSLKPVKKADMTHWSTRVQRTFKQQNRTLGTNHRIAQLPAQKNQDIKQKESLKLPWSPASIAKDLKTPSIFDYRP